MISGTSGSNIRISDSHHLHFPKIRIPGSYMYAVGMVQKGFDGYVIPSLSISPAFPGSQKLVQKWK